jgi:colanic acid/amylovoran biosynthesis glycosyltransferase
MKSLRIAFVVGSFPSVSQTFILNQIISLIKLGHNVQILSYSEEPYSIIHSRIVEYELMERVKYYYRKPKNKWTRLKYIIRWYAKNYIIINNKLFFKSLNILSSNKKVGRLDLFFKAQWFLEKRPFDVIHAHFGGNATRIAFVKSFGFLSDTKFVTTFHGFDLVLNNVTYYRKHYLLLSKECHEFTINTKYLLTNFKEIFPKLNNYSLLPVGLETDFFKKTKEKKKKRFTLLFCGRLVPLKGADLAIDILNELIRRGYNFLNLLIIGEGEERENLKLKIDNLNLVNYVEIKGALNQEMVKKEMDMAAVFLMPGIKDPITRRAEAQGLVIQEAQAMQLPILVSDVGGMKYGLLPGKSGHVLREKDINGFSDAIEELINNEELRLKMGEVGRAFVVENYDSKVLVQKLLEVYYK